MSNTELGHPVTSASSISESSESASSLESAALLLESPPLSMDMLSSLSGPSVGLLVLMEGIFREIKTTPVTSQ